jgi:hypothetical protein
LLENSCKLFGNTFYSLSIEMAHCVSQVYSLSTSRISRRLVFSVTGAACALL